MLFTWTRITIKIEKSALSYSQRIKRPRFLKNPCSRFKGGQEEIKGNWEEGINYLMKRGWYKDIWSFCNL